MTDVELFKSAMRSLKKKLQDVLVEKEKEYKEVNQEMVKEAIKIGNSVDNTKPTPLMMQEMVVKVLEVSDGITHKFESVRADIDNLKNFIYN